MTTGMCGGEELLTSWQKVIVKVVKGRDQGYM
jgi:hypothetical protein